MICTSIEQSKKLVELGLDINSADMFWDTLFAKKLEAHVDNHHLVDEYDDENRVPAWSLSALLELIPNYTIYKTDKINIVCNPYDHWEACYNSILDAAFEMVCWLLENGYIRN